VITGIVSCSYISSTSSFSSVSSIGFVKIQMQDGSCIGIARLIYIVSICVWCKRVGAHQLAALHSHGKQQTF
jgi:hypothetical protein